MTCPDYYILEDEREFRNFFAEECLPLVPSLNDMERISLFTACAYLFRRGMKGDESEDVQKYRHWLKITLNDYQPDSSPEEPAEYALLNAHAITPVLALVEFRRSQKIGKWKNLLPQVSNNFSKLESIPTAWGPVESFHPET